MAIKNTGNFGGGSVAAPDIGSSIRAFGDVANQLRQEEHDKIANARAQELLGMQRAEHQMKVDAIADAKEKEKALQAFAAGVSKPRELSASGSMFAQVDADPKAFDERMKSLQLTEAENVYTDSRTDQATKDRMLAAGMVNPYQLDTKLGKQAELAQMAQNPTAGQLETRTQQVERTIKEMAQKGMPITTAVYQELDKARLADEAAKTAKEKQLDEMLKDAKKDQIDAIKFGVTEYGKDHRGAVLDSEGNVISSRGVKDAVSADIKRQLGYQDAIASIPEAINAAAKAKNATFKPDEIESISDKATQLVNNLVDKKIDPSVAKSLVASSIAAGNDDFFFRKEATLKDINENVLNNLIASGKKLTELEAQKTVAGAKGTAGSLGYDVGVGLTKQAEADVASIKAQKALLNMTPEERQFATTKNRLDALLKPAVDTERGSASASTLFDSKQDISGIRSNKKLNDEITNAVGHLADIKEVNDKNGNKIPVKLGEAQIWGIIGNVVPESGFNTSTVGDKNLGAGKEARGIMQWRLDRADALRNYAGEKDISKIPVDTQLKFAVQEMANRAPVDKSNFNNQLEEYMSIKDPKEAAAYISMHYEVAKGNTTRENEAKLRGDLTGKLFADNQKAISDTWQRTDKAPDVIESYKADLVQAMKDKDYNAAGDIGARLKSLGVTDAEVQDIAAGTKDDKKSINKNSMSIDILSANADSAEKSKFDDRFKKLLDTPINKWTLADRKLALSKDSPLSEERPKSTLFDYFGETPRVLKRSVEYKDAKENDWNASSMKPEEGLTHANLDLIPLGRIATPAVTFIAENAAPLVRTAISAAARPITNMREAKAVEKMIEEAATHTANAKEVELLREAHQNLIALMREGRFK